MRMRKPIDELARFHRQKQEVEELKYAINRDPDTGKFGPKHRLITVNVVGCIDLKGKNVSADMAPFFYY